MAQHVTRPAVVGKGGRGWQAPDARLRIASAERARDQGVRMDLFDFGMLLIVGGGVVAIWLVYRKPKTVTHGGLTYRRRRDGSFSDDAGRAVTGSALTSALAAEYVKVRRERDERLRSASSGDD